MRRAKGRKPPRPQNEFSRRRGWVEGAEPQGVGVGLEATLPEPLPSPRQHLRQARQGIPPLDPPTPPEERLGSSDVAGVLTDRLACFLIGEGLRVEQKPLATVRGYFDPGKREIALNDTLPRDDGWLKSLGHDTAHYLAGDTAGWEGRPLREFVAESSAYASLLAMGVDTSDYSLDYIKWWTREPGMVRTAMPEIAAVTKRLIAIMEGERPEEMGEWV